MDISLLTLLIGLALGTFALGFVFARLAKMARLSAPSNLATEGASASLPATPEPADVLTQTQLHYQQSHINGLNGTIRLLEEKVRWLEQDRQEADDAIAGLQQQLKTAKEPRGDEVTQREAELALLRAQLNAAISNAGKLERKLIRTETDAQAAREENQALQAKLWAQQSTDVALSRLQDRQTALQAAINDHLKMRETLAGEVVALTTALAERDAALSETERRLYRLDEDYARLATQEQVWEKQQADLADARMTLAQTEAERDDARRHASQLQQSLAESHGQIEAISERLHALHEAMALRDGQVTELHGELRRLQQDNERLQNELKLACDAAADLGTKLAPAVAAAEETRLLLRMRDSDVDTLKAQLVDSQQQREQLEATLEQTRSTLKVLHAQVDELNAGRLSLEAELQTRTDALVQNNNELAQSQQQREQLEAALVLATGNLESLRGQANNLDAVRLSLEAELLAQTNALAQRNNELAQSQQQREQLEAALVLATGNLESLREQVNDLDAVRLSLEAELQTRTDALNLATDDLSQLSSREYELTVALERSRREYQSSFETMLVHMSKVEEALANAQQTITDNHSVMTALEAELQATKQHAGDLAEEVETLGRQRNTLEMHLQSRTAVLATTEAVIASMRDQLAERDQQLADVRTVMNERGRELESARAEIAYLAAGLDSLNATANEKHAEVSELLNALREVHAERDAALTQAAQLKTALELTQHELSGALTRVDELAGENAKIHQELIAAQHNAGTLQVELEAAQLSIEQLEASITATSNLNEVEKAEMQRVVEEQRATIESVQMAWTQANTSLTVLQASYEALTADHAHARDMIETQAGEIIALLTANNKIESEIKLAEQRVADLAQALEAAGARQAGIEAERLATAAALVALQQKHAELLTEKAAVDGLLEAQAGEIDSLAAMVQQREVALAEAETRIAQLSAELEQAGANSAILEAARQKLTSQHEMAQSSLTELRQAHAALLQEHDTLRRSRDALELQTHNQMESLVEMSDAAAALQKQLTEREQALQATQVSLAEAKQIIATKPDPGTIEARLIDTSLTLQRLEKEFAALQFEKEAIEDEYTRHLMAEQLRMQDKEVELRECGAKVDALQLEIALMRSKDE